MKWSEQFPKALRLRRRAEFLRVQKQGLKISSGAFLALAMKNSLGMTRIGFTVSRKEGAAVQRNRMRRRLRELFRKNRHQLPQGLDLVLITRPAMGAADTASLQQAFSEMSEKLRKAFP